MCSSDLEPIDQVVVADACQEVVRNSLFVGNDHGGLTKEAWRQTYSDHYPVTVTLRADGDDDPDATFTHGGPDAVLPTSLRSAPAAVANASSPVWPPAVGSMVSVTLVDRGPVKGKLLRALPENGQGWLVLELEGGDVLGIPLHQVRGVSPVPR